MITEMLMAGVGGFAGKVGRYLTGVAAKKMFKTSYPVGTFTVNVVGCLVIGIFFGIFNRGGMSDMGNALLIAGFCGGFTTFSSFSHDCYSLLEKGEYLKWLLYIVPSVALGLLGVWVGMLMTA